MPSTRSPGFVLLVSLLGGFPTALQAAPPLVTFTSAPEVVAPGLISTAKPEVRLAVSPDGTRRLWGTIGWEGGPGGWDIWGSSLANGIWSAPTPVSFNTPSKEFDPSFAPDGRGVYFFSNRPGGAGGDDIYFVPLDPVAGLYGSPVNLGPSINGSKDEWAPVVSADGRYLLFASDSRGGLGLHDLYVAERIQKGAVESWGKTRAMKGLNSKDDDFDAAWLSDGKTIVFSRKAETSEEMRLFVSRALGAVDGTYTPPMPLGSPINREGGMSLGPSITTAEPGTLYFTSVAASPATAPGLLDIFRVTYTLAP